MLKDSARFGHHARHVVYFTSSRLRCLLPCRPVEIRHAEEQAMLQVMPDDHSKLVPPLPIPNRTVKRLRADDSASTRVKVGHRQASILKSSSVIARAFFFSAYNMCTEEKN